MVGVSRQAVTAVLNNSRPNCVSKEKREAILKAAAEHNYRPDHAALALKTGKSGLIGVIMPPWENPYIAGLCISSDIQQSDGHPVRDQDRHCRIAGHRGSS